MDMPVAYCPDLEEVILPGSADVLKAIQGNGRVLTAGPAYFAGPYLVSFSDPSWMSPTPRA